MMSSLIDIICLIITWASGLSLIGLNTWAYYSFVIKVWLINPPKYFIYTSSAFTIVYIMVSIPAILGIIIVTHRAVKNKSTKEPSAPEEQNCSFEIPQIHSVDTHMPIEASI